MLARVRTDRLLLKWGHCADDRAFVVRRICPPVGHRTGVRHSVALSQLDPPTSVNHRQRTGLDNDALRSKVAKSLTLVGETSRNHAPDHLERRMKPRCKQLSNNPLVCGFVNQHRKHQTLPRTNDRIIALGTTRDQSRKWNSERVRQLVQRQERGVPETTFELANQSKTDTGAFAQGAHAQTLPCPLCVDFESKSGNLGVCVRSCGGHVTTLTNESSPSPTHVQIIQKLR